MRRDKPWYHFNYLCRLLLVGTAYCFSPNVSATSRQLVTSRSQSRLGLGRKGLVHIPVDRTTTCDGETQEDSKYRASKASHRSHTQRLGPISIRTLKRMSLYVSAVDVCDAWLYTWWTQKWGHKFMAIILSNLNRFQFFHWKISR